MNLFRLIMRCIQIFTKINFTPSSNTSLKIYLPFLSRMTLSMDTLILGLKRIITPQLWLAPCLSYVSAPFRFPELYSLRGRVCFSKENNVWILVIQPSKQLPSRSSLVQRSVIQRHDLNVVELSYGKFVLPFSFSVLLIVTQPKWEVRRSKQLVATWFQPASCTKGKPG